MRDFAEESAIFRRSARRRIAVPVAVCVSKIDLLDRRLPEDFCSEFYTRLEELSDRSISFSVIEDRSHLTYESASVLWPQSRVVECLFGCVESTWRFFPLTPVGLLERWEDDLWKRPQKPYGLLEPLLWLMHCNGYQMLRQQPTARGALRRNQQVG